MKRTKGFKMFKLIFLCVFCLMYYLDVILSCAFSLVFSSMHQVFLSLSYFQCKTILKHTHPHPHPHHHHPPHTHIHTSLIPTFPFSCHCISISLCSKRSGRGAIYPVSSSPFPIYSLVHYGFTHHFPKLPLPKSLMISLKTNPKNPSVSQELWTQLATLSTSSSWVSPSSCFLFSSQNLLSTILAASSSDGPFFPFLHFCPFLSTGSFIPSFVPFFFP